jgi:hypothetical protein
MLKWLKPQSLPHTCVMSVRPIAAGNSIFYHSEFSPMYTSVSGTHLRFNFWGAERTSLPADQQNIL